jgi:AcrR family transcriptional regulator
MRERTRRAVQAELIDLAQGLFVERGYEATTIDVIAAEAGMSKRTFFRYFDSKEDLVLGKYDQLGEDLATALAARPADEDHWTALRRMFDHVVEYMADENNSTRAAEMNRIVSSTDSLRAAYRDRMHNMHGTIAHALRARAATQGHRWPAGDPTPQAIVGAAFACLEAANATATASTTPLAKALDRAMNGLIEVANHHDVKPKRRPGHRTPLSA